MDRTGKSQPQPLGALLHKTLDAAFAKQGFASTELLARWSEIVGAEIAEHSQPEKIRWPRRQGGGQPEPGTLVLRVEGPTALEIQHLSAIILERVNRFFGWPAIGDLRLHQAPLVRRKRRELPALDQEAATRIAAELSQIRDDKLRAALGRLGAAVRVPGE
jgi:hypothetical protein